MNRRLNIKDIALILAESTGKNSKDIELFLKELVVLMCEQIFIDKLVVIKGLGAFKIISIEQRESIDVNTKERITLPEHYKLSFLPEKPLRELVNKPFSFFESIEINEDAAFAEINAAPENEKPGDEKAEAEIEVEVEQNTVNLVAENPIETLSNVTKVKDDFEKMSEQKKTVTIEEEVVSEKQLDKKEAIQKGILSVLLVVLLAVIGVVGYMNSDLFLQSERDVIVSEYSDTKDEVAEPSLLRKEEIRIEAETKTKPEVVVAEEKKETFVAKENPISPPKNEDIIAKVKMQTGSRLTLLSLDYYGNKIFWVYIYDYNKNVIKNPNNVSIGTEISIPNPKLYGIDSENAESIKTAAARQTELLSQ